MRWEKARLLVLLATVILVSVAIVSSMGRGRQMEESGPPLQLNEILSNDLSDSLTQGDFDRKVASYMTRWNLTGLQLSMMRNDSLILSKGYGWADREKGIKMQPYNILRLASVSKLVTAVGIMLLKDRGELSLKDTVFRKIITDSTLLAGIRDKAVYGITVEDLLRHKSGLSNRGGDPMFSTRSLIVQHHLDTVPSSEWLLKLVLGRQLDFVPGTSQSYSNFGYLLLSMIIEKISGQRYEDFIRENVLEPAGCVDFHIANNYYKDRYPNEVRYYTFKDETPVLEYNNSGREVARCYGANDVHGLSGAGAWLASSAELSLLVAAIDGRPEVPDIISHESVEEMVEYFDKDTFSLGWNDTNPEKGWTRTGTFSGTSALIKYFPDGECWTLITNTSTWKGPGLAGYTAELFDQLRAVCGDSLPKRNLFYELPE